MVDLATLTGACVVALGNETAGLFSNDNDITDELLLASTRSFEPIWPLPIADEHKKTIRGRDGDISNIGKSKYGGASSAAAFLARFIQKGTKWAHLDIAGPAMAEKADGPICADNTGFGAALILNFIRNKD